MTWHLATNHITSPHVTSQPTALLHRSLQPTTSKQVTTSPPWNGWRLVHSNNSVWASQSLVTLCAFYRQILSLTYSFSSWKLPPPACPALLVPINTHCFGYCLVRNGSGNATLRMVDVGYVILIAPNVRAGSCRHEAAGDVDVPFCFDMKQPSTYLRQCRPTVFKSVDVMGLHSMVPRL